MKVTKNNFANTDIGLSPYLVNPEISETIQQTLARLLGWDNDTQQFKLILVDGDGRVLVSTSPTQASSGVNSQATVGVASSVILAANTLRKQYIIQNLGTTAIYLGFGSAAVVATGFQLPPNGIIADDVFIGEIQAISTVAAQDVRIVEM